MDKTYAGALNHILKSMDKFDSFQNSKEHSDSIINLMKANHFTKLYGELAKIYKLELREIIIMHTKVENDGYAFHDIDADTYRLTFKGKDFLKRGGYVRLRVNLYFISWFKIASTIFLVFGAIATIFIAFLEYVKFSERKQQSPPAKYNSTQDTTEQKVKITSPMPTKAL